jgi:UDP-glucuronate 4-epimerase
LNIGNHRSVEVRRFVAVLEESLGRKAVIQDAPRPVTDVAETFADIGSIQALCGFEPKTPIEEGVPRFADWFREGVAA